MYRLNLFPFLILLSFLVASFSVSAQMIIPDEERNGLKKQKNWIAVYIWDSFAPLTLDKTVPEMLTSLEVIFQQHATYSIKKIAKSPYGSRSTEGHFMIWMHLEEGFFEKHKLKRSDFPENTFLFKDRETDIFTAWCGQANFRDFILDGVSGLTNKTVYDDGTISGSLDSWQNAQNMGNAEYGAGYYLSDQQAINALKAIHQYPGFEKGYSFISKRENRPEQDGFEHPTAVGVNGYNCNDFAFYMLNKAGVLSKAKSETLKVAFWYPEHYWNHTIPLRGSGAKIYKAFDKDRSLYMNRDRILKLAWSELLFAGLDIFDERALIDSIAEYKWSYNKVRVWDQMTMIDYLKNPANRDFKAKLVIEELQYAVKNNLKIKTPFQEKEQKYNYRVTDSYYNYKKGSEKRTAKKMKKNKLQDDNLKHFQSLESELKTGK